MEKHSIQLIDLGVKELKIVTKEPPEHGEEIDINVFSIGVGYTDFDEENQIINVGLILKNSKESSESSAESEMSNLLSLNVEIVGSFLIDTESFPKDKIEHFAQNNAPYILMPYLREHVYSLTQKSGFKPVVLPLFQIPTFKIENKSSTSEK